MLEALKEKVFQANMDLKRESLVILTWGNASEIDREKGLVVIKPSGVPYSTLRADQMVVVDLYGQVVEGELRPSVDTVTHLVLYQNFPGIGGVVHTHSTWATIWAQAGKAIPCLGGTHADHFFGEVPCTRPLSAEEIAGDFELESGRVIVECFKNLDPGHVPGVLIDTHGPFTWGDDALDAVHNSVVLEEVAKMAFYTLSLQPNLPSMNETMLAKRFFRKHGAGAYYGQK
ncbi:MAG TPA: L-ribulose-5-phosphate 4-epimerase [Atribacteraceae bacterium]|nr:L-ribulose-5-phosphate 4-epimerase [Atribacteraceae bacterium]